MSTTPTLLTLPVAGAPDVSAARRALVVEASVPVHPVSRVGNGMLYGLADAGTPGSGGTSVVDAPTLISAEICDVIDGSVSIPVTGQDCLGAYRLVLRPT